MALHLRIQQVRTTSQLRSAANANELAAEGYTVEGDYVIVESQAEADKLLDRYSNLELELDAGDEGSREPPRAELTTEGVDQPDEDTAFDAAAFVDRTPMSEVIEDLETGEYDDHLDAIEAAEADGRDRQGVADAIADRREA